MSSSNCCFLTCIHISQEAGQVVWYSHLFKNFPHFVVIHTVKDFDIVNKAEVDVFLELSCFFYDPTDVCNLGGKNIPDLIFSLISLPWNILTEQVGRSVKRQWPGHLGESVYAHIGFSLGFGANIKKTHPWKWRKRRSKYWFICESSDLFYKGPGTMQSVLCILSSLIYTALIENQEYHVHSTTEEMRLRKIQ